MERKNFIKSLSMMVLSAPAIWSACEKNEDIDSGDAGDDVAVDNSCVVTPSETEGPYPTKSPSSYVRSDIRKGDGLGVDMLAKFTIVNVNNNCNALEGAIVDIWHCDVDGDYSQYNSDGSANWYRGRQVSDSNGQVKFQTIFPGWYRGRATHIHVHIYNNIGTSLLITQVAFQDSLVKEVNTTGANYGYTKGVSGITYNSSDDILRDSLEQEMCTITGSMSDGYDMSITLRVKA